MDSVKDYTTHLYKGFDDLTEALDYARINLGQNYFITPTLRSETQKIPQYNIKKDTNKIIFCDHCSSMTEAFKRLNHPNEVLRQDNENLINEKGQMLEHISILQDRIKILHFELSQQTQPIYETRIFLKNSPSSSKMENPTVAGKDTTSPTQTIASKDLSNPLMGVHSPKNVERPTVSGNDTASPAQTVAGKDFSNP